MNFTEEVYFQIAKHCTNLLTFCVKYAATLTDRCLIELVRRCGHTLKRLDIPVCCEISDRAIFMLATNCPKLQHLDIQRADKITQFSIQAISYGCECLDVLVLSEKWDNMHIMFKIFWSNHPNRVEVIYRN